MTAYRKTLLGRYRSTRYAWLNPDDARSKRAREEFYDAAFRRWLPSDPQAAIADVGCGDGQLLGYLAGLGFGNLSGVDLSPEQAEAAKTRGFAVDHADALTWLRGRRGLDVIIATDLIEHLIKDEVVELLAAALEALKPGGSFLIQTPNMASSYGTIARYADFTHETGFTETSLAQVILACGFERADVVDVPPPFGLRPLRLGRWLASAAVRAARRFVMLAEVGAGGPRLYGKLLVARAVRGAAG